MMCGCGLDTEPRRLCRARPTHCRSGVTKVTPRVADEDAPLTTFAVLAPTARGGAWAVRGAHQAPASIVRAHRRCLAAKSAFGYRLQVNECVTLVDVAMDYRHLITISPGKRSGQPCIRDLRITICDVLDYMASGMTVEEVLADFSELTDVDIRACLAFAADRERGTMIVPPAASSS